MLQGPIPAFALQKPAASSIDGRDGASGRKDRAMEHERLLDRREFTAEAALAALAGVVITISGCGGGGYSSPSSPSTPSAGTGGGSSSDKSGTISSNHGHLAVVTGVELTAGNAVQLDIRGSADHTHQVTLAADAIQAIQAGRPAITDSTSTTGHLHTVTFNSDSPEPPTRY